MDRREKKKLIVKIALASLAALLLVTLGLFFLHRWEMRSQNTGGQTETGYYIYKGVKYRPKDVDSVLLIGIDKFADEIDYDSYNNQQQSDFLMLLVVDPLAKTCTPVHINRDTIAPVTVLSVLGEPIGTIDEQLALAHTYGSGKQDSGENTRLAVSDLLAVPLDHYISVTMDAVTTLNDLVGGVTVLVEDDFSNVDKTLVQGERVHLMGEQALHFVRSRSGMEDSSNLARMKRQRTYLTGLRQAYVSSAEADEGFVLDSVLKLSEYMVSDCNIMTLADLVSAVTAYEIAPVQVLEGTSVKGEKYMEYYVDEEAMEELVVSLFYEPVE